MTIDILLMRNGTRYLVLPCRELGPKNLREGINDGFKRMSRRSRWLRFASAVTELSDSELDYLTDLDGSNRVAWCAAAIDGGRPSGIGLARYFRLPDEPEVAEFAISVVDEFHGQGVGSSLLEKLIESARSNDIRVLRGYVLPQNERMLGLCRHLQATLRQEDDVLRAEIQTAGVKPQ